MIKSLILCKFSSSQETSSIWYYLQKCKIPNSYLASVKTHYNQLTLFKKKNYYEDIASAMLLLHSIAGFFTALLFNWLLLIY